MQIVEGAARTFSGDISGAAEMMEGGSATMEALMEGLLGDPLKAPWFNYALSLAEQGVLLPSAADPLPWFYVTHYKRGVSCSGKRITLGAGPRRNALFLGFTLASPRLADKNNLTVANLKQWNKELVNQGMDGMQPLMASLIEGFAGQRTTKVAEITPLGPSLFKQLRLKPEVMRKIIRNAQKEKTSQGGGNAGLIVAAAIGLFLLS